MWAQFSERTVSRWHCRLSCQQLFPGTSAEDVRQTLLRQIDDPKVAVSIPETRSAPPPPTSVPPSVLGPIEKVSNALWPGVPVIPMLQPGGTDGAFLNAVGIPTYGVSGIFADPDLGNIHGLNERLRVQSLMEGRDFLYRLVKVYADQAAF